MEGIYLSIRSNALLSRRGVVWHSDPWLLGMEDTVLCCSDPLILWMENNYLMLRPVALLRWKQSFGIPIHCSVRRRVVNWRSDSLLDQAEDAVICWSDPLIVLNGEQWFGFRPTAPLRWMAFNRHSDTLLCSVDDGDLTLRSSWMTVFANGIDCFVTKMDGN